MYACASRFSSGVMVALATFRRSPVHSAMNDSLRVSGWVFRKTEIGEIEAYGQTEDRIESSNLPSPCRECKQIRCLSKIKYGGQHEVQNRVGIRKGGLPTFECGVRTRKRKSGKYQIRLDVSGMRSVHLEHAQMPYRVSGRFDGLHVSLLLMNQPPCHGVWGFGYSDTVLRITEFQRKSQSCPWTSRTIPCPIPNNQ